MPNLFKLKPHARARKTKRAQKRAKATKEHNQEQSKKTSNENNNTICVLKNATGGKKTQGKLQAPAKNVFKRNTHSGQTAKGPKGPRKRKQYRKAGHRCPKQVVNRATKKFRLPI